MGNRDGGRRVVGRLRIKSHPLRDEALKNKRARKKAKHLGGSSGGGGGGGSDSDSGEGGPVV